MTVLIILKNSTSRLGTLFLMLALLMSCSQSPTYKRVSVPPSVFVKSDEYTDATNPENVVKLHMRNGDAYILKNFHVYLGDSTVTGQGILLNPNRELVKKEKFTVSIKDVVLIETNLENSNPSLAALTLVTGVSLVATLACIMNPKACFGSCPTFYASDGYKMILQAEGFSGSVSPSLEDKDVDALYFAKPENSNLTIKLTNEALETHVIKYADILAFSTNGNNRVYSDTKGKFYLTGKIINPTSCAAPEGDCSEKLMAFDENERYSVADSSNLASKEILELSFDNLQSGQKGLVLAYRQTLMTTFLYYQALSYMGKTAGDWLAMFERGDAYAKSKIKYPAEQLGGINAYWQSETGNWELIGKYFEVGPISRDIQLMNLNKELTGQTKIRLEMTKGLWRIDLAALVNIEKEVEPLRIKPSFIIKDDRHNQDALSALNDDNKSLVTLPGDCYFISYELPGKDMKYELFLESRGYYIEWMREEWLKDENPAMLTKMMLTPGKFLKDIAPEFKKIESSMEESFWRSKYVKQ